MTAHSPPTAHATSPTGPLVRAPARSGRGAATDGRPDEVLLSWEGDLDIASSPVLASALTVLVDLPVRAVVMDLSAVAFMDCAGLATLLDADSRLQDGLRLLHPSRAVLRLLGLVDLPGRLATVESTAGPTVLEPSIPDTVATIEQSKGLVMASFRCTTDQATKILVSTALRHNVQVQVLSALLVTVSSPDLGHAPGGQARAVRRVMGSLNAST